MRTERTSTNYKSIRAKRNYLSDQNITPQLNFYRKLPKISQLNLGFCSSLKALAFVDTAYLISITNMIIFSTFH